MLFDTLSVVGFIVAVFALAVGFYHVYEIRTHTGELKKQAEKAETHTQQLHEMLGEQRAELGKQAEEARAHTTQLHEMLGEQRAELGKQAEEARAHTELLDTLRTQMSTRFLGKFPIYLEHIVHMLSEAEHEIVILCDFPAYGAFSNHDEFFRYRQTLQAKINDNVTVDLTCFNREQRTRITHEQFLRTLGADWRSDSRLKSMLEHQGENVAIEALAPARFIELLEEEDTEMLEVYLKFARKREISSEHMPLYLWMVDDRTAIFAILSLSERAIEYGFRTIDRELITALRALRDRYHSVPAEPPISPTTHP